MNRKIKSVIILVMLLVATGAYSQNPNHHIYLCFGQSNMEGQGTIETQDKSVDERFKVLQAMDCSNLSRDKANWYTAVPPTCQCWSKLSPADYFGRTMIANLPDSITVGIINVAVGGCDIRLFDKDIYTEYDSTYTESWFQDKIAAYEGNPFEYLMNLAKLAQQDGVIKGILLHQGETNTGDVNWPTYVEKIYNDMLNDLELQADEVPLLAGEVVHSDQGGVCASMNTIINKLPETIPTAHIISSSGCQDQDDNIHFNSAGYRELGRRYAVKMLALKGVDIMNGLGTNQIFIEPECGTVGESWQIIEDAGASNEHFISANESAEGDKLAPGNATDNITLDFEIDGHSNYDFYVRVKNINEENTSLWYSINNEENILLDEIDSGAWEWFHLGTKELEVGSHTLHLAKSQGGMLIDKVNINNFLSEPVKRGDDAIELCDPQLVSIELKSSEEYFLGQNYPNPFSTETSILFQLPEKSYVSLKVYDIFGKKIIELAGKEFAVGKSAIKIKAADIGTGYYFYVLETDRFLESKQMIILGN